MAVARPKRLTTVVADPVLVPTPSDPVKTAAAAPGPGTGTPAQVQAPDDGPRRPPVVVVREVSQKDDSVAEDLTPARLRPRRVIVIK
jgi:hypothetical protein